MSDALTPLQVEVMRRVRDGNQWSAQGGFKDELREAVFLCQLGLLVYAELGKFELSDLGQQYLADIEAAGSGGRAGDERKP